MKSHNFSRKGFLLLVVVAGLFASTRSQAGEISLCLQQTPDAGGAVNPAVGIYHYSSDSEVKLTATPNPGYQFVYWLGDVSDPKAVTTVVHLNKPKIIVAVFEQTDSDASAAGLSGGGGGGAGLFPSGMGFIQSGNVSVSSGSKPKTIHYGSNNAQPPVVPEPATGLLLALGTLFILTQRHRIICS
jgi:hypothetical protein